MQATPYACIVAVLCFVVAAHADLDVQPVFTTSADVEEGQFSALGVVVSDGDSGVISCGYFDANVVFPSVEGDLSLVGAFSPQHNMMCVRFNEDGLALWGTVLSHRPVNATAYDTVSIGSVAALTVGPDNAVYLSGSFPGGVVLPCGERGLSALCTTDVPGNTDMPLGISLEVDDNERNGAFYAKLDMADGGAVWAYQLSDSTATLSSVASDGVGVVVAGDATYTVTIPETDTGVESLTFACDLCSFVCSIDVTDGGALWCSSLNWVTISGLHFGDGGQAVFAIGVADDSLAAARLSFDDAGSMTWTTQYHEPGVAQWSPVGVTCYADCESLYTFGMLQYNTTYETMDYIGFAWALDDAGNDQWFVEMIGDSGVGVLLTAIESSSALYAAGTWIGARHGSFLTTIDYLTGEVQDVSALQDDLFLADMVTMEASDYSATLALSGAEISSDFQHGEAVVLSVIVSSDVPVTYPSATATPAPTSSPLTSPSPVSTIAPAATPSSYSLDSSAESSGGEEPEEDDDDWVWWVIGIIAISCIVCILVAVVVGGVIYRRKMKIEEEQEDPYDYEMLSKDMFKD